MKKAAPKLPKIDILYEDADFVAINKPAGLVVHSDGKTVEPLLTDWVVENYPKTAKVGEPIVIGAPKDIAENASAVLAAPTGPASTISSAPAEDEDDATTPERIALTIIERPGIVHRLDRGTSGVIVIAKNQKAHAALKEQFQARSVSKKYLASSTANSPTLPTSMARSTVLLVGVKKIFAAFRHNAARAAKCVRPRHGTRSSRAEKASTTAPADAQAAATLSSKSNPKPVAPIRSASISRPSITPSSATTSMPPSASAPSVSGGPRSTRARSSSPP